MSDCVSQCAWLLLISVQIRKILNPSLHRVNADRTNSCYGLLSFLLEQLNELLSVPFFFLY